MISLHLQTLNKNIRKVIKKTTHPCHLAKINTDSAIPAQPTLPATQKKMAAPKRSEARKRKNRFIDNILKENKPAVYQKNKTEKA
jgi:ribosome-binding ATPase YchF (GTP1/OBG family)